jgi:hypothetical protein
MNTGTETGQRRRRRVRLTPVPPGVPVDDVVSSHIW